MNRPVRGAGVGGKKGRVGDDFFFFFFSQRTLQRARLFLHTLGARAHWLCAHHRMRGPGEAWLRGGKKPLLPPFTGLLEKGQRRPPPRAARVTPTPTLQTPPLTQKEKKKLSSLLLAAAARRRRRRAVLVQPGLVDGHALAVGGAAVARGLALFVCRQVLPRLFAHVSREEFLRKGGAGRIKS